MNRKQQKNNMSTRNKNSSETINDECNNHTVAIHFRILNEDKLARDGNGAQICRNENGKMNTIGMKQYRKPKIKRINTDNNNEYGQCRKFSKLQQVGSSWSNKHAMFNLKFTFHRMLLAVGILLCVICSLANGQTLPQFNNMRKPDIFSIHKMHHVIQPRVFDGSEQRQQLKSTRQTHGEHAPHIILEYKHLDKLVVADLFLNTRLLTDGHFLRSQNANGTKIIQTFNRTNVDLCHYQGQIRNNPRSKMAVSTCDGIKGFVYDGNETYSIQPNEKGTLQESHYLFSQSQIDANNPIVINSTYEEPKLMFDKPIKKAKRSISETPVYEPYNANKQSSFVELVIVIDNDIYKELNQSLDKVHKYCKDIANIINSLYVPLNIFIALVGVVVWTEKNEIELSNDGDKTLKNFLNYRRKVISKDHQNDNAQLLTKEQFDGGVVGKALKGPICTYEYSGGVSTDHSPIISIVATTIAHEMGHNFGMEHDTDDCKCPDTRCIMSASSSSIAPTHWSECSIDQLNLALHQGMNHCLRNVPKHLFESPTCGNGFVEIGEECDCGLPNACKNTCCDPMTCKLRSNATCATGKCCNLQTCQPHDSGYECRSSDGECDLPEYCNGDSEYCPLDYFKRDTEECQNGKSYCYQGQCKTRDDQCKLLWGLSGKTSDKCYDKNTEGSRHGNCGLNRETNEYKNCTKNNIFCGMLQCRHLNERLEFGLESVAILSHSFISHGGSIIPCRTAIIDLGLHSVDPGMVPDGAKCGDGKLCIKQECVPIDRLQSEGKANGCLDNCNGHGVCDNLGHCHCDKGFAPPFCDGPGPGGSVHSGPASPDSGSGFVRVMFVFFLGVVPFISLSLFIFYYCQQNRPWFISQPPANDLKVRHYPDRSAPQPPSAPPGQLSPSNTDDMNATLLKTNQANGETLKRELFGNFKGFSLKPLPMTKPNIAPAANVAYVHPVAKNTEPDGKTESVPVRAAPLPPSASPIKIAQIKSSPKLSSHTFRYQNIKSTSEPQPETPIEVKLFASKSNVKERPKISAPVLENSTCSVKELIAAAKFAPNPDKSIKPSNVAQKQAEVHASSMKKSTMNKGSLKSLDISAPVKSVTFGRSQSMRSPNSEKPELKKNPLASGSMRKPAGVKRQMSIVDRPKNPPPPRPKSPDPSSNAPKSQTEQLYTNLQSNLNGKSEESIDNNSTDNIYCVIEDIKPTSVSPPNGLLSEIVNEIENRNKSSIYSTSKRKNAPNQDINEQTYQNVTSNTTNSAEQPLLNKISEPNSGNNNSIPSSMDKKKLNKIAMVSTTSQSSGIGSLAKKFNGNALPGKPKPIIASKPSIVNALEQKFAANNQSSSQKDSTKTPIPGKTNKLNGKPLNTNTTTAAMATTTSNVRSLHKRFENPIA